MICSKSDGESTAEHTEITRIALLFVLVWPAGLPLCYLLLLLLCRRSLLERRQQHV